MPVKKDKTAEKLVSRNLAVTLIRLPPNLYCMFLLPSGDVDVNKSDCFHAILHSSDRLT